MNGADLVTNGFIFFKIEFTFLYPIYIINVEHDIQCSIAMTKQNERNEVLSMQQTLLILEDNASHCRHLQTLIEEYNIESDNSFRVIAATSLAEAERILEQQLSIDAFLLDISMDDTANNEEGLNFAKHLHNIRQYKEKPVLFLTAYGSFLPAALNELHCYAFLMKPYRKEELFRQLCDLSGLGRGDFHIKTRDGIFFKLKTDDLFYIQANGRYLNYVTATGSFSSRQHTLSDISGKLPNHFVRCHKSYIINTNMVVTYDFVNHFVELQGIKSRIPISRKINSESIFGGENQYDNR